MDDNSRTEYRTQLHRYPHLLTGVEGELLGFLGNISRLGMMLITYQPLPPESVHDLVIKLPAHHGFSRAHFPVRAEVRWQRVWGEKRDLWCSGAKFTTLSAEDEALIEEIQINLGFEIGYNPERFPPDLEEESP